MSALPPKADMCSALAHVCFGPKADIGGSAMLQPGGFNSDVEGGEEKAQRCQKHPPAAPERIGCGRSISEAKLFRKKYRARCRWNGRSGTCLHACARRVHPVAPSQREYGSLLCSQRHT